MSAPACSSPSVLLLPGIDQPSNYACSPSSSALLTAVNPSGLVVELAPQSSSVPFIVNLWRNFWDRRARTRSLGLVASLDRHILRDVGAPPWLVNQTTVQNELQRMRDREYLRW